MVERQRTKDEGSEGKGTKMTKHFKATGSTLFSWMVRLSLPAIISIPSLFTTNLNFITLPIAGLALLVALERGVSEA